MSLRIAVLGSTRGTAMLPIIEAIHEKKLSAEIVYVISNKIDALILEKARNHEILGLFMDKNVHEAVLQAGVKETGCTVHYVTEAVDAGEIILQKRCEILANDTAESLKNRVQKVEGEALVEACQQFHLLIRNP